MRIFGIFGVFFRYFLGVFSWGKFWESKISGRGVFFRYFSWKFGVGPFWGSVAGRGVLKYRSKRSKQPALYSLISEPVLGGTRVFIGNLQEGVGRKGFPWFVLKTNRKKSEQIRTNRNKSRVFPKTRSGNRNKSEENGEIGTDRTKSGCADTKV